MWQDLISALALVFVLEGIAPFASPGAYRRVIGQLLGLSDRGLRTMGLLSMIAGLFVLYLVR